MSHDGTRVAVLAGIFAAGTGVAIDSRFAPEINNDSRKRIDIGSRRACSRTAPCRFTTFVTACLRLHCFSSPVRYCL